MCAFVVLCLIFVVLVFICCGLFVMIVFFFQAEDGIRDLVRSRGLGDVYKRQVRRNAGRWDGFLSSAKSGKRFSSSRPSLARWLRAVSYTHLTLPTSDLV